MRIQTGHPSGMPTIVGVLRRIAVSRSRNSCWMLKAPAPSELTIFWRWVSTAGASGTGEFGSTVVLFSFTLELKYQGLPLGWLWLIHVADPLGPYWKPVIWNSEQRRLK